MGILDWLFGRSKRKTTSAHPTQRRASSAPPAPSIRTHPVARPKTAAQARWVAPGETVTVHYDLPGGMIYVGAGYQSHLSYSPEPSLIDPSLPVRRGPRDPLGYWPSYATASPENREAFLSWLASGRQAPVDDIGLVFIFFYGLERRVLVERMHQPMDTAAQREIIEIRTEVDRLVNRYGDVSNSFRQYATSFRDTIDLLLQGAGDAPELAPPPLTSQRWEVPASLRLAIGRFAQNGTPIPAEWALAWAWYFPEARIRTPATRCPDELRRLFYVRYTEKFGTGLRPKPGKSLLRTSYRAASSTIGSVTISSDSVPNTYELKSPARKLIALLDDVQTELDPYSRWRGRNPDASNSLEGIALLPAPLITADIPTIRNLEMWLETHLTDPTGTLIPGRELIDQLVPSAPEKLTKTVSGMLTGLLEKLGIGVEPDVRMGGAPLSPDTPVVLFRLNGHQPPAPSPDYANAMTMVHITAAVSASDGHISGKELDELARQTEARLTLSTAERQRLHAHMVWLSAIEIRLTGLKKRLAPLDGQQRQHIADIVVSVASADGVVSPREVSTLRKIYGLLGLDENLVTGHLHTAITSGPTLTAPAETRQASRQQGRISGTSSALDPAAIARKQRETAAVSELLASIFTDEDGNEDGVEPSDPREPENRDAASPTPVAPVNGLDASYVPLLHALTRQDEWPQHEFDALAESFGLMPAGALDVINEYAYETWGEPFIEVDDPLLINDYVRKELQT